MIYIILFFVVVTAVYDIAFGKIPNWLVLAVYITGSTYTFLHEGVQAVPGMLVGILLPIVLLFGLFYIRALGAGDVKLFSALGSVFGFQILDVILYAFIFGAVQSIYRILKNWICKEHIHKIPFALSILGSVIYVVFYG